MVQRSMPIGVDDFKEAREKYYLVDKTDFIRQIIDGHSKVTLITRPRRFGKTLTMSMLDYSPICGGICSTERQRNSRMNYR